VRRVLVVLAKGLDELALARRTHGSLRHQRDFRRPSRELIADGRVPELVVMGHGHAPVGHGATRVGGGDLAEGLLGGGVGEGMQQRDRPVEPGPNGGRTGGGEAHRAQFLRRRMVVVFRRGGLRRSGKQPGDR